MPGGGSACLRLSAPIRAYLRLSAPISAYLRLSVPGAGSAYLHLLSAPACVYLRLPAPTSNIWCPFWCERLMCSPGGIKRGLMSFCCEAFGVDVRVARFDVRVM